mgnify:CR=1 FL=1
MNQIKLALDWTPNVNHIGFFIAKEMGFYAQFDINLEILNPADDNYQTTPGKKLENNSADFAITPFETVISLNNKKNKRHQLKQVLPTLVRKSFHVLKSFPSVNSLINHSADNGK